MRKYSSLSLFAIPLAATDHVDEYSIKNYKPNQAGIWIPEQSGNSFSGLSVQRHHTIVDQPDLDASILGPCEFMRFQYSDLIYTPMAPDKATRENELGRYCYAFLGNSARSSIGRFRGSLSTTPE